MKIVADENIVFAAEFFAHTHDQEHNLVLKAGRDICHADLVDADALLVRSVTQVNAQLLDNTSIKFVGTATIGTDHIDQAYLKQRDITFADAAGCSADTVAQYVITAIHAVQSDCFTQNLTLGIIGYGNIGRSLAAYAQQLGWHCVVYDPFVTQANQPQLTFTTLTSVLTHADIVSLHVPLTYQEHSAYPTFHLINAQTLAHMPAHTMLINTARGKVVCEADLLDDIAKTGRNVIMDVFEHEPKVSTTLLNALTIATPHIAGYSLEGKARGTQFIYDAFCKWQEQTHQINRTQTVQFASFLPQETTCDTHITLNESLQKHLPTLYDIAHDHDLLKQSVINSKNLAEQMVQFDLLRKHYSLRREWRAYGL